MVTPLTAGGVSPKAALNPSTSNPYHAHPKETAQHKCKRIGYSMLVGIVLMIVLMQWADRHHKEIHAGDDGTKKKADKYWTAEQALERASANLPGIAGNVWKEGTADIQGHDGEDDCTPGELDCNKILPYYADDDDGDGDESGAAEDTAAVPVPADSNDCTPGELDCNKFHIDQDSASNGDLTLQDSTDSEGEEVSQDQDEDDDDDEDASNDDDDGEEDEEESEVQEDPVDEEESNKEEDDDEDDEDDDEEDDDEEEDDEGENQDQEESNEEDDDQADDDDTDIADVDDALEELLREETSTEDEEEGFRYLRRGRRNLGALSRLWTWGQE